MNPPFNPFAPDNIAVAIIAMNFFAFTAFGIDKAKAEQGQWRIKESTLLMLAFLGGTIGAYAGRAAFRHKTRKQPFSMNLHFIAGVQLVMLAIVAWLALGHPGWDWTAPAGPDDLRAHASRDNLDDIEGEMP